jgi:hypothetical protein
MSFMLLWVLKYKSHLNKTLLMIKKFKRKIKFTKTYSSLLSANTTSEAPQVKSMNI